MVNEEEEVIKEFQAYLESGDIAVAVAAIKALTGVIQRSNATTMMELEIGLRRAVSLLTDIRSYKHLLDHSKENATRMLGTSKISVTAACELFLRYVTRCFLEYDDFAFCRQQLISRGEVFSNSSLKSRNHISEIGHNFVRDDMVVLTHGGSRVVFSLLIKAAQTKRFSVIVTESRPFADGFTSAELLRSHDIPTTVIPDAAIGYIMEKVDIVLVGAEGVVENGGVINRIGTFSLAMAAKAMNKPFYVSAESYKFARLYPLNQGDLPDAICENEEIAEYTCMQNGRNDQKCDIPTSDFTPPQYITLLFTDIGILTPSAVSDELIKLYQ